MSVSTQSKGPTASPRCERANNMTQPHPRPRLNQQNRPNLPLNLPNLLLKNLRRSRNQLSQLTILSPCDPRQLPRQTFLKLPSNSETSTRRPRLNLPPSEIDSRSLKLAPNPPRPKPPKKPGRSSRKRSNNSRRNATNARNKSRSPTTPSQLSSRNGTQNTSPTHGSRSERISRT